MAQAAQAVKHGSLTHIVVLAITGLLAFLLVRIGRRRAGSAMARLLERGIAALLLLNAVAYIVYRWLQGYWELRYDLPMEFCSWATIVTAWALFKRSQAVAELAYLWVMAGSLQGVLTPDLQVDFPHPYFFMFVVGHSGLVIAALLLAAGMGLAPRPGAIGRTLLYTQIYFVSALLLDYALGANYGYLMHKPAAGSLLDYLGPWPYYWLSLQALMMALVSLAYLPFYLVNRRLAASAGHVDAESPRLPGSTGSPAVRVAD
ncbi:MAG: TIGR02206 family membrane protein [Leptospirales bacterium]|nr:TIGR02206 family membrane protein [Leptospirales bacterium]